jgi:DnaK suppressor protein
VTKRDTKPFSKILETEAAGLRRALHNRGDVAIESVSEECEQMTLAGLRDLALVLVDRTSRRLRDVEAALRRIKEGDFGACVDCDEEIPTKRLTAIPWASRCVRCQEAADSRNDHIDSFPTPSLHDASSPFKVDPEESMTSAQLAAAALLTAAGPLSSSGLNTQATRSKLEENL